MLRESQRRRYYPDVVVPLSLTRRQFLGSAAVAAAAVAGGCTTMPRPEPATSGRVIVVGAGLSGLTAALALRAGGWEVTVLEARSRVGGRVHTLYSPFTDGLHVEAGGESIDDNHVQIQALARYYRLALAHRPADKLQDAAVYRAGRRTDLEALSVADPKTLTGYVAFGDALLELAGDLDPAHPERAPGRNCGTGNRFRTLQPPRHSTPTPSSSFRPTTGATTTPNSTRCLSSSFSNSLLLIRLCRNQEWRPCGSPGGTARFLKRWRVTSERPCGSIHR